MTGTEEWKPGDVALCVWSWGAEGFIEEGRCYLVTRVYPSQKFHNCLTMSIEVDDGLALLEVPVGWDPPVFAAQRFVKQPPIPEETTTEEREPVLATSP